MLYPLKIFATIKNSIYIPLQIQTITGTRQFSFYSIVIIIASLFFRFFRVFYSYWRGSRLYHIQSRRM